MKRTHPEAVPSNAAGQKKPKKRKKPPKVIPLVTPIRTEVERKNLIDTYHTLMKKIETVQKAPELDLRTREQKLEELRGEAEKIGGLERYQEASLKGQNKAYKFNTAKWVAKIIKEKNVRPPPGAKRKLSLLDVGSLCNNYLTFKWLDVMAIDLNPCHPSVQKMDFFDLSVDQPFDIVVLSLVVNFVGDPAKRGEMLARSYDLLSDGGYLFLVLPLACVENSRYLTNDKLLAILVAIGYTQVSHKNSRKLAFYVLRKGARERAHQAFTREVLRTGPSLNNFSITLARAS